MWTYLSVLAFPAILSDSVQFTEAKHYHAKLVNIRKEMLLLHEKTSKLKVSENSWMPFLRGILFFFSVHVLAFYTSVSSKISTHAVLFPFKNEVF